MNGVEEDRLPIREVIIVKDTIESFSAVDLAEMILKNSNELGADLLHCPTSRNTRVSPALQLVIGLTIAPKRRKNGGLRASSRTNPPLGLTISRMVRSCSRRQ